MPVTAPPPGTAIVGDGMLRIPLSKIRANPLQPRKAFDDERLRELAQSIREDGVLQPVVVRRRGDAYELIMGERRLQAARLADIDEIPVVVREDVRDVDSLRLALVENIQRENLNAIEVGHAYRELVTEFGLSQQELAGLVGRDRSSIANSIRLLNLPEEVQQMVIDERITGGHARALLSLPTGSEQLAMARRIVEKNMNVRDTEFATGTARPSPRVTPKASHEKPAHITDLEKAFSSHLGTRVAISEKRGGKGRITIEFYSHEEFERLTEALQLPLPR